MWEGLRILEKRVGKVVMVSLMGSRGYGYARPDSDYDLFAVAECQQDMAWHEGNFGFLVWPTEAFWERLWDGRLVAVDAVRMRVWGEHFRLPSLSPRALAQYAADCTVVAEAALQSKKPAHLLSGGVHVLKAHLGFLGVLPPIKYADVLKYPFPAELQELRDACARALQGNPPSKFRVLVAQGLRWVVSR